MLGAEAPPGTTNCTYLKQPDKQELAKLANPYFTDAFAQTREGGFHVL